MVSRDDYNNTSNFDTTEISGDGRFLGIKVSPSLASQLNIARGTLMSWISDKAEKIATPTAKKFAERVLRMEDEKKIGRFSSRAASTIAYTTILSNELMNVGTNIYDSIQSLNEMRSAVSPLVHSGNTNAAPLSGNNEVVANARKKINSVFWQRLLKTGTDAIAIAPSLWGQITKQSAKNRERELAEALEANKDNPDEIAKILKGKITPNIKGVSSENMQNGIEAFLEKEAAEYQAKFDDFEKKHGAGVKESLEKLLGETTSENYRKKMLVLKNEYNIDISGLRGQKVGNYYSEDYIPFKGEELEAKLKEFKAEVLGASADYVDDALRIKFVAKEGAFDGSWTPYRRQSENRNRNGHDDYKTNKQKLEERIEELQNAQNKNKDHGSDGDNKNSDMPMVAAGLGGALASEVVSKALFGGKNDKHAQPVALDRILQLRRELDKAGDAVPEQVVDKYSDRAMSYAEYVHNVFEQHQRDSHRSLIGERFVSKLQDTNWDDKAIQGLKDEELNPYEFAVKTISKRIKDGRMDSIALVNLVGDKVKKIVHSDGRNFGPSKGNDTEKKEAILKLIDEQTLSIRVGSEQTEAQLNEKLGNFIFSLSDLKHALESNVLSKDERAFIFTAFSDVVGSDKALCKKLGISDARCEELRKECKTCFTTMLDNGVVLMADMIQNTPQNLDKLKLTDKEKEVITKLAEQVRTEGKHAVDTVENREELKSFETVIVNAAMSRDLSVQDDQGRPRSFLQRLSETRKDDPRKEKPAETVAADTAVATDTKDASTKDAANEDVSGRVGFGKTPRMADAPEASAVDRVMKKRSEKGEPSEGVAI